jgi:hypothetical protein
MLRVSAIHRMGELRLPGSAEYLLNATKESAPEVRRAALGSIRFIGGPEHQEFWKQRLQEQDPELRAIAVDQLGGLDDPSLDKPLEQVAAGQDAALAQSAKMHLDLRGHRRDIQKRMMQGLNPTKAQRVYSALVNAALSRGWQAVALLLLPCLLAGLWALRHGENLSSAAAALSLTVSALVWSLPSSTALMLAFVCIVVLTIPLIVQLVRRTSSSPIFDSALALGLVFAFSPMVFRSAGMGLYLGTSLFFGATIIVGAIRALIALRAGRAQEAVHCIVYSYALAVLLGCMPYAFIGM